MLWDKGSTGAESPASLAPSGSRQGRNTLKLTGLSRGVVDRTGLATKHVERDQAMAPFGHASRREAHIQARKKYRPRSAAAHGKGGLTDSP